jgi:CheY-like chemotaxis protein
MEKNDQTARKSATILLVDDVPDNLKILGEMLKSEGYGIRQVSNGLHALHIAEKEMPDLILLDIMMPEMDGYEVCQKLKQNPALIDIPVIFISALGDTGSIVKALTVGGVDYINKPFQEEEVKARVNNHLRLSQQTKELLKLNAERAKFFSIIAHDLRGPISGIMQLIELMADEEQELSGSERKEMISHLKLSTRNTFNLLENLLEWSKMGIGLSDFNPQRIDLKKVVAESVGFYDELARGKEIELATDITGEPEVIADKNMLQSVIRNLLSNAIKFTSNGGKVTISANTGENNQTVVSVKDTGIGMTEDLRTNLFRIDANTKRPGTLGERSTGLGLLLCKEFVEKQGGTIRAESVQNVGSVLSFSVPFAGPSPKREVSEKEMPDDSKKVSRKNLNILIAEDDEITAKLISYFIKGISKQVFRAKTGVEAVEICLKNPALDLVIMDIKMPSMDGYEATRQIRQFNPTLVIIAQSTFAMPGEREIAIEAGITDYVMKPFHGKVFVEMAQKYV